MRWVRAEGQDTSLARESLPSAGELLGTIRLCLQVLGRADLNAAARAEGLAHLADLIQELVLALG